MSNAATLLPSVVTPETQTSQEDAPIVKSQQQPAKESPAKSAKPLKPLNVRLEIPVAAVAPAGYQTRRVDVQQLTEDQTEMLHRMLFGMKAIQAKTANGKFVTNLQDVFKYILEQASD